MKIRTANEQDLAELSGWFFTESDVKNWGGPAIRFPLNLDQLKIDIGWDAAESYALVDGRDNLLGFAQAFNKFGCKHLGRIALSPEMRGKKLGKNLMAALLKSAGAPGVCFSLFVYEDNIPAKRLYESIGFVTQKYPEDKPEIKGNIFMVKET